MPHARLELYTFNYRDPRTGKWIRARYRAERSDIEQRHSEFEITGPAEIRDINTEARHFNPHFKLMMNAELRPFNERAPELQRHPPAVDAVEAFLVGLFLRRYVTYCARRRRFTSMNGAVRLRRSNRRRHVGDGDARVPSREFALN